MSDPSHNAPAVFRRVRFAFVIVILLLLGAQARTGYAVNHQPAGGEPQKTLLASFDEPQQPPPDTPAILTFLESDQSDLPFPPLKLPLPAGAAHVTEDGGYNNGMLHLRGNFDQFALDLCEGADCQYGRHVVAPTDITYDYSTLSLGYHFFEVYDDGSQKVCMSLGHFYWPTTVFPLGYPEPGTTFPQGAVLGEVSWWGGMPHAHIGLWTMPSQTPEGYPVRCHYWTVPKQPQPFTGIFQLDGLELSKCTSGPYGCYNVHSGEQLVSTNAAYSYFDLEAPPDVTGIFVEENREPPRPMTPAKTGDTTRFLRVDQDQLN